MRFLILTNPLDLTGQLKHMVEWLALLFRVWEVPGSGLGPETGYTY
jgi:hypothetical protein